MFDKIILPSVKENIAISKIYELCGCGRYNTWSEQVVWDVIIG